MNIPSLYTVFQEKWNKYQTCYIISDTHFGDKELAAGQPNRPDDEEIIKNINSKVGKIDILLHLGDVGDIEAVKKLRGYKILIMGNHDSGASNYKRQVVKGIYDKDKYTKEQAIAEMRIKYPNWKITFDEDWAFESPFERWVVSADNMLFDEVYEGPLMISEKLILSHEPVDVPWAFNLHGHIHDSKHKNDKRHFNACAEAIDFTPINFNQWMKQGHFSRIETIHRTIINSATIRKAKRGGKKFYV